MASDKKRKKSNVIPVRFVDAEPESVEAEIEASEDLSTGTDVYEEDLSKDLSDVEFVLPDNPDGIGQIEIEIEDEPSELYLQNPHHVVSTGNLEAGGPLVAELVATRAELKRVEAEVTDLKDRVARRQAEFENYRKRVERERAAAHERVVAEVAAKLLPVLDNLKRALDAESSVESNESDEFRHFLSGVDLILKQLSGVLDTMGVKPVVAVGARFDPHIHEAVVSEPTDDYEPDTVMQEITRGYSLGDKLIRPAMVKVAIRK
ncbi:MAG: nucleotide exchange factor GrpE [Pyrinomonadaceae bacterium]